jgi:hypothetical protein
MGKKQEALLLALALVAQGLVQAGDRDSVAEALDALHRVALARGVDVDISPHLFLADASIDGLDSSSDRN